MKIQTIKQLNQLNRQFYQTTAKEFDQSRQYFWQGWEELQPDIKQLIGNNDKLRVLDLGCGNARFAQFLDLKLNSNQGNNYQSKFSYLGVDSSPKLLTSAQSSLKSLSIPGEVRQLDLVSAVLEGGLTQEFEDQFDLIVLFGVWHHLPSYSLRQGLLEHLASLLSPSGMVVITAWQFAQDERFAQRQIDPQDVDLEPDQFEAGDYLLDWRRGEEAVRYCHFSDLEEMETMVGKSPLSLRKQFYADGKSEKLNLYLMLES